MNVRSFEEIQATGYRSDAERAFYLSELLRRGVTIAPDAQAWLDNYNATQGGQQTSTGGGPVTTQTGQATTQGGDSTAAPPGYGQDLLDQARAQEKMIQDSINATQVQVQNLQGEVAKEIAKGNNASAEKIANLNAEIARESNRIALLNAQVNQAAEIRMERELQAQLAANPNDFVAYEFYKRALGQSPTTFSSGGGGGGGGMGGGGGGAGSQGFGGTQYPSAPPAYSDESLQTVASNLFANRTSPNSWNPNLSGEGVFGAEIAPPNTIGRASWGEMSDSERQIIGSFLKAGINMGGRRVALDPADYFKQMSRSWIPTLQSGIQGVTQYA
jgi:hypothetical protein